MRWKRCSKCGDLKPVSSFWKKGNGYQSKCIKCLKAEYIDNKEQKKEYDRKRYQKNKTKTKKEEYVCMRCDEFVANVRNNQLYWCFHCLKKYEEEWKQPIEVRVINPVIRRSEYYKEKMSAVHKKKQ